MLTWVGTTTAEGGGVGETIAEEYGFTAVTGDTVASPTNGTVATPTGGTVATPTGGVVCTLYG